MTRHLHILCLAAAILAFACEPDNGGNIMCLDLNTLTLDWVQEVQKR